MINFTKLSSPNLLLALTKWEVHFIYFLKNYRKKAIKKLSYSQKVQSFREFLRFSTAFISTYILLII